MPGGNQIRFGIGFDVNKAGLNELKKSLLEIQQLSKKDVLFNFGGNEQQAIGALKQAKAAAKELEAILNKAFNPALGTINVSKFQNELNKLSSGELNSIYTRLSGIGAQGTNAFNRLATSAMTTNVQLKQTFSILESMKTTLANTVKWTVASSAVNALTGSISSAFNYVKALDNSLTDIRIVTGQSREEMAQFAVQANEAAQALGRQTKEYTNAALTYYQQGLGEAEVQARTEATLKAQNVTGAGTEMADYLTAVWNGFKVSAENTELYVDKLAAVADSSASNLSELAIAMSKVASTANNMGVDIDQLSAQISTIVATTRQAPETVGNALKTIYARINDIKSGSDEAEISLGNYTGKMRELGINVLDASERLRDTGDVMEEIGSKWTSMTREQQIYLAQTMAGQRQMNNLIALFDNWQQYSDMLNVSLNAQGSLNEKNARYMDSLSAHLNQFKAATEGLQGNLIDPDGLNPVIDMGTDLVNIFSQLVATMGGMKGVLLATGSILTTSFSSNIADGLIKFNQNIRAARDNAAALQAQLELSDMDLKTDALTVIQGWNREATQYQQAGVMSPEQRSALNEIIGQYESLSEKVALFEEKQEEAVGYLQSHAEALRAVYKDAEEYDKIIEKIVEDKKIEDDVSESLLTALDSERDNFNSIAEELKEVEKQYKETAKAEEDYQKAAGRKTKDRGNKKTEFTQAKQNLSTSMQAQLKRAQDELITQFTPGSDIAEKYKAAFADMQNKLAENVDPTTFAKRFFETYKQLLEDLKNKNEEAANAIKNTTESAVKQNEDALKQYEDLVDEVLRGAKTKQTIQGIVSGLGALAGVASGVQTVANAFASLNDETLTSGQKVLRLIEGLGYGLPMAISSLKTFTSSLSDIKKGFSALRSIIIEAAAAKLKNAAADGVATVSELTLGQAVNILSKKLWENVQAWIADNLAMLGWAAAITVAVLAVIGIVKAIDNWIHAEEYAAEAANKRAESTKKNYEDIKQTYDDLKSSLNDYRDAKTALDQMVAGTEEWKEALQKVNDQVLELINKYPELAQYVNNVNGELVLSEKGRVEALRTQRDRVQRAQQINLLASNEARTAQNRVVAKELARSSSFLANTDDAEKIIKMVSENSQILAEWAKLTDEQRASDTAAFNEKYLNGVGELPDWAKAILSNTDVLQESIATIRANTAANDANTGAIMAGIYENNPNYNNSEYQDAINRYSEQALDKAIEFMSPSIESQLRTGEKTEPGTVHLDGSDLFTFFDKVLFSLTDSFTAAQKEILDEYAEVQGYKVGDYDKRLDNKVGFVNEEGQSVNIGYDEIAQAVASNRALDNLNETVDDTIAKINEVATIAPELTNFIGQSGDFAELSAKQVQTLMESIDDNDKVVLEEAGIMFSDVEKAAGEAENAVNNIINSIESKSVKNAIENLIPENKRQDISANDTKTLTNLLQSVFIKDGKTGLNSIVELFGEFNADKYSKLFEIISNFSSGTTLEQLTKQLQDAGIQTSNFKEAINFLYNYLHQNTEAIVQNFKDAKDVANGIEFGDGISAEDAEKLKAIGINLDEFFITGADGMQVLIADAKELRDTIYQMQMSQLADQMNAASEGAQKLADYLVTFNPNNLSRSNIYGTNSGEHMDTVVAQQQYDYLQQLNNQGLGDVTAEELAVWQDLITAKKEHNEVSKADRESLEALSDAVQRNIGQVNSLKEKQNELAKAYKNSKEALDSFRLKLDEDVDEEEWRNLTKTLNETASSIEGVSEELENDKIASAELAQAILRFDNAIVDITDHYEDWQKALAHGSLQEQTEAMEEMRDAYADLLDLDGDSLSDNFLKSAENLELMQQAANGSEDAYNKLKEAVQEDIIAHIHLSPEDMAEFQSNLSEVESALDDINFEDLEVEADLNIDNFLASLTDMVNAAGMSVGQATDYLASMGIDAQVVEHSSPTTETKETGGFTPVWQESPYPFSIPVADGQSVQTVRGTYWAAGLSYEPNIETVSTTSDNKAVSLQVTSAHKSSGGGFKYKQASHGGGSKKAGKSGGGGGKGGGGGSSKAKEPTKPFKSKIDPYHDINIKIGNTKEGLNKLEKQRDKLIGKAAVENLRQQVDMMEKEKELLREKAEIAKEELQRQAQELANLGATFDTNGDILNYKDLLLNKQNQINEAITYGNTLQGDEREAYDKYIKDLEQEYKDLESAIKEYDDTQQILDDLELDYADLINEQIEKAVEAFNIEIELHLDLKDAQKEFNEFRKKVIDQIKDDEFGRLAEATARNYQNYYSINEDGTAGGIIPELRQHAEQIKKEIETMVNGGWSNIYGDNLKLAAEDLKKTNDELMQNLEEAQDVIDEVHEHFLDAIDALSDAFDKQQEAFDKVDDFIQHDIELIQLVRGEEDYEALTGLWEQQVATDVQRLEKLRQQQDYWKQQLDQYEEGTDEWKAAMENWQESFAALNEAMIDAVKNLQSQWENSMNRILKDLGNSVYGGDRSRALEEWENLNWHSDRYLDNLARANGLLNLQAEFTKAINAAQDPKRQKELADLEQKQLDALSKKEHIREIDLKLAQQQLTVMQAQMALEDAQQSKTKMRLRRDSQGNYTYQYVADEDNIAEKTQEYMNVLEEYRNMAKEGLRDVLDEMNDVYSEWEDKVREAFDRFGSDTEAFKERIEVLQEEYFGEHGKMSLLAQEANDRISDTYVSGIAEATEMYNVLGETAMQKLLGPGGDSIVSMVQQLIGSNGGEIPSLLSHFMVDTYEPFIESLDQKTHDQLFSVDGIFPEWGAAISGLAKDYVTGFVPDVVKAMNLLLQSHQEYINGLGIIERAAGRTFKAVQDGLDNDTGYTKSLKDATDELVNAQKAQVEQAKEVYKTLKDNEQAFKDQTKAAIDAANALYLYWLTLNGQTTGSLPYSFEGYTGVTSSPYSSKASPSSYSSSASGGGSSGSSSSGGGSNNNSNGNSGYTSTGRSGKYDWRGIPWEYSPDNPNRKKGASYSSGGYTGAWDDSSGRLAILHQKELVLNEEDTKNMLAAVNITRAITNGVSSMATAALSHLSGGRKYSITDPTNESVLQNVVINADFPAVQDAAQIKQAFNELVNIASQRASKNRRAY